MMRLMVAAMMSMLLVRRIRLPETDQAAEC